MNAHEAPFGNQENLLPGSQSVLVADDDPTSRLLVSAALENSFAVTEAENGLLAVEALEEQSFDLAILDLDMPVMDGFGVIERARLRRETKHLPIIVVTGRDDVVAIERAFALGATSFLCKPINWNIFRHQVGYVLQVARIDRETRAAKRRIECIAEVRERSSAVLETEIARAAAQIGALSEGDPQRSALALSGVRERLLVTLERVKQASDILTGTAVFEPTPVDAADLAEAAMESVRSSRGEAAAGRIVVTGEPGLRVRCDRRFAALALVEMLNNALAHSAASQPVRLGILAAPPGRVRFEIEDCGSGIPEHRLETGFEAFGSGHAADAQGGIGLGIPIARSICEQEGGHFGIMSEPGRGTEVFMSFPTAMEFGGGERDLSGMGPSSSSGLSEMQGSSASLASGSSGPRFLATNQSSATERGG